LEEEIERDRSRLKSLRMIIVNFLSEMIEIASFYDENENDNTMGQTHILTKGEVWIELGKIITKEPQKPLKVALNKTSNQEFDLRLGTSGYEKDNIRKFQNQCKNVKLRHIYFGIISKDFFTI
jgi:hypothetical protein